MRILTIALVFLVASIACAQKKTKDTISGYDHSERGTMVHPTIVYVAGDDNSQHVAEVSPGHEVVVMERNGAWVRVFANTDAADDKDEEDKPEFSTESRSVTPAVGLDPRQRLDHAGDRGRRCDSVWCGGEL